jgi:glyoxylase-like metal-dependent hydrolase (beta-lactamase superfamily II)
MQCLSRYLALVISLIVGTIASLFATSSMALSTVQLSGSAYAIIGETSNRSSTNLGNNANFGFIVGPTSVLLIDAGAGTLAAKAIEQQVRQITPLPISHVINTGGQDHRWLGNSYFQQQGAKIIASQAATEDHNERAGDQLQGLNNTLDQDPMAGLAATTAEITFEQNYQFTFANLDIKLHHQGPAHTPGDSWVYIPQLKLLFTGDIAYGDRMLGVIDVSDSQSWVEVFEAMAQLDTQQVVPGHGQVSTMTRLKQETYDYLVYLRTHVGEFIDAGGELMDIRQVDQSTFSHLLNYKEISPGNALRVFEKMEWE